MAEATINGFKVLILDAVGRPLATEADAIDIISQTYGFGAEIIVIPVERLSADFLRLSTRLAGAFIQKMQTYHVRLVFLGDISGQVAQSDALADFVRETNRTGHHLFTPDLQSLEKGLR